MSTHVAGVLLHITSLPSAFPCGSLGTSAHQFLNWMSDCGLKLWQTLPLHPIDGALSPYSSTSAFAGAPHLIDVEILAEQGWLTAAEIDNPPSQDWVGNGPIQEWLLPNIPAAERFAKANPKRIKAFIKAKDWVEDWALFQCLIKRLVSMLGKTSQHHLGIEIEKHFPNQRRHTRRKCTPTSLSKFFFEQWNALKAAAAERNYPRWRFTNLCIEQWC